MNEMQHSAPVKMLIVDIGMWFLFLLLFGFSIWLIWITYFREHFDTGIVEKEIVNVIDQLGIEGMDKKSHFHNLDATVYKMAKSPSICMKCHGSYAHSKTKQIRAFLNAHAYFMACEVCHLEEKQRTNVKFKWLHDITGTPIDIKPSKLTAKIIPIKENNGSFQRLDESSDRHFVDQYLLHRDSLDADQEAAAKVRIHRNVSETAIACDQCHISETESYLKYAQLNYTKERISEIAGTEIVGMIQKYKKFYLPKLYDQN